MAQSSAFFATVLLLVFSTATEFAVCQSETFTIVPSNESPCPADVCYTLDQLAQNFTEISQGFENVTLDLLPGDHALSLPFRVQNFTRFDMRGNNARFSVLSTSRFQFEQTRFIYFSRIDFVINSPAVVVDEASEFVIEDCTFESNERIRITFTASVLVVNGSFARSSSTTLQFITSANVIIKDSVFADSNIVNSSLYFGLILAIQSSLTVDNCRFVNNSISVGSTTFGIITAIVSSERFSIMNSTFLNNNAGSVAAGGGTFESVVISGCVFSNNNIFVDNRNAIVSVRGQNVNITDTTFINNILPDSFRSTLLVLAEHGSIQACTFENNNSTEDTASLSLQAANSSFVVEQNRFSNNINSGIGTLSVNGDSCSMLTFRRNMFTNNSGRLGGTLDLSIGRNCPTILIEKNNFTNNSANGGAMRYRQSGSSTSDSSTDIIIVDNVFVNNSALLQCGSAINSRVSFSGSQQTYRMQLNSTLFDSNRGVNTSLVCLERGFVTITNSSFSRGSGSRGGALQMTNTITTVANSTFRFNYAIIEGGAIYASESRLNITNSTLENNQADSRGGAVSIDGGLLMVTNTSFANNSAGGGRGDNILACFSEVVLSDDTLFSVRQDPFDSECFFYNKALSHGSFSSLAFFIVFTTMSVVVTI